MNGRGIAALALAGAVVAAVVVLSTRPEPARPSAPGGGTPGGGTSAAQTRDPGAGGGAAAERAPFETASECRACHEDLYAEWQASYHGMAWTDPMVQALSLGFQKLECIDCHAPMPIHVTGVGVRVAPRKHSRSDGVDCLSCHLLEDGVGVAATRTIDTSATPGACRPTAVPAMSDGTACAGCHNQHETLNELAASGLKETCNDCHMPSVDRKGKPGRSHVFPGGHDVAMHRRAAKLDVTVADGRIAARVTNVGAGHHIPTDARHRSYNLWVSVWDPRGNLQVDDQQMPGGEFRLYYRDDFRPSTQIAHGAHREAVWPIPEGLRGRAVVRLVYALNPEELGVKKVTEVHRVEVELP